MARIVGICCRYCEYENTYVCKSEEEEAVERFKEKLPGVCPKCEHKLSKSNEGYYYEATEGTPGSVLAYMREARRAKALDKAEKLVAGSLKKTSVKSAEKVTAEVIQEQGKLRDYLRAVVRAYGTLYYLQEELTDLFLYSARAEFLSKAEDRETAKESRRAISELEDKISDAQDKIEALEEEEDILLSDKEIKNAGYTRPTQPAVPEDFSLQPVAVPDEPRPPMYATPGFFNKKRVERENETLRRNYEAAVQRRQEALAGQQRYETEKARYEETMRQYNEAKEVYERQMNEYNEGVKALWEEKRNAQLQKEKDAVERWEKRLEKLKKTEEEAVEARVLSKTLMTQMLEGQVEQLKGRIEATAATLNRLLAYDVIYPKYRNYVAVCSMFEYIDSKRCHTLEGPDGAYNLYESDIKANLVIEKLGLIVDKLDQIKENQHALYTELRSISTSMKKVTGLLSTAVSRLGGMSHSMAELRGFAASISKHTQATAENTEQIAANSAQTARNTEQIAASSAQTAQNTAITAYYAEETAHWTKKNAELTNALGFLVALK